VGGDTPGDDESRSRAKRGDYHNRRAIIIMQKESLGASLEGREIYE